MMRSGVTPRLRRRFWLFFSAIATAVGSAGLFIAHGIALMAYDDNWEAGHWQAEYFNAWVNSLSGPLFWVYWLTKIGAFVLLVATDHDPDRAQRMVCRHEVLKLAYGEQTLGEGVGAAHALGSFLK